MLANVSLKLSAQLCTESTNTPHLRRKSCPFSTGKELGFSVGAILGSLPLLARAGVEQDKPAKLAAVFLILVGNKLNKLILKTNTLSHIGLCEDTDSA